MLHVRRAANARDGAEDVGEGAVPPFLQRLDRDDVLDGTAPIEEIDAVELPLIAGRDRDLLRRDPFDLDQVPLQRLDRHLPVLRLCLEQHDGADAAGLSLRRPGQPGARGDRAVHRVLPILVLGQHDRQLDHLLPLQLLRRHAVQDVRLRLRSRRELDDGARVHPRLHLPRQPGDRVVRFIHDHQRTVEVEEVGEGELDAAALPVKLLQPRRRRRNLAEVRLHLLVVGIHLAPLGVGDPERLDGADDDAAVIPHDPRAETSKVGDVEHLHPSPERLVQHPAVGMTEGLQRLHGLAPDGVGRDQPQHHRPVFLDPGVARDGHRMGGEDRLAPARGQTEADVGRVRQRLERRVGSGVAAEPRGLLRLPDDRLVGVFRPGNARVLQEATQDRQRIRLILLEFHGQDLACTS